MSNSGVKNHRSTAGLAFSICLGLTSMGCGAIQGLFGGADKEAEAGLALLDAGDLPGAGAKFSTAAQEHPDSTAVATGAALTMMMQGDHEGADAVLAAAEATAGEQAPSILLRRALVALQAGDLDAVRTHGEGSGLPAGQFLAAEVALADGEREEAQELLEAAKGAGGDVGDMAKSYLELIESDDPLLSGMSEVQALWALGERKVAVRSVEDLVLELPDDQEDRSEQLLIWAGRAASVRETDIARSILNGMVFPPPGQAWRKVATEAIINCADGKAEACIQQLDRLEGSAPADGLADARATAAMLIAEDDGDAAEQLVGPYISNAAARALVEAGNISGAKESVPGGVLATYLEGSGF